MKSAAPAPEVANKPAPEIAKNDEDQVKVLKGFDHLSRESATCVSCHREKSQGLYQQWGYSKHFRANVGCYECHKAKAGEPDAIKHKDSIISIIVSPQDCAECHKREVAEFDRSHHATGGLILDSLDNVLADVVEGAPLLHGKSPVVVSGCEGCHGSKVEVNSDGTLSAAGWPNSGIGRLNPDGSKGSCSACHTRHSFSAAQARHPDTCGRCHLGPDHPQKEIYGESQHGINFFANLEKMNLASDKWIVGEDYSAAPACATCHMSATKDLPITHDIGSRIAWNLRAPISFHVDEKDLAKGKQVKPWLERRQDMKTVCAACHSRNTTDNFFEQFDTFVELYNEKFAKPGDKLMKVIIGEGLLTPTQFDEELEWTWFYLWHHEGRRARHGAAMMGPDFAHWEGMYEVAHRFYIEMVPQVKELLERAKANGKEASTTKVQAVLDEVLNSDYHRWYLGKAAAKAKQ
jgi:hypothetical protein